MQAASGPSRRLGSTSTAHDVFAQRLALGLGFLDLLLHDVADRDHGDDPAALSNRQVAETPFRHDCHDLVDPVRRRNAGDVLGHQLRHRSAQHFAAFDPERPYDVTFGNDAGDIATRLDRKSTRLNSSHMSISYAVFCLKKKTNKTTHPLTTTT